MHMNEDNGTIGMNSQEERELRRVFDHLAFYRQRKLLQNGILLKKEEINKLENYIQNTNINNINMNLHMNKDKDNKDKDKNKNKNDTKNDSINNNIEIEKEIKKLEKELEKKNQSIQLLNANPNKLIHNEDLYDALKALGKICTKKEVNDMIWEADENLDNAVDWDELKALFNRNLQDKTELEPSNLFNVIQFMTYDKKLCGIITADDTMAILFARYGRVQLETKMKNLFGESDELTFINYLERVGRKKKLLSKQNIK